MERYKIPACYYPTTALFIDDDRNLEKLCIKAGMDSIAHLPK